jgi:nicotinamide-nucleotide amidase
MIAEVIGIGDELTSGLRLDTNSPWLSERLGDIGVPVKYHTTVADDLAANVRVFREALARAEILVVSGGLGPTADDLTRQALAEAVGVPLVQDLSALEHIKSLYARRKREMPPANVIQSYFPQGSVVVPNPHGTAPGIDLTVPRANGTQSRVFCLPGVPAEMKEMWQQTVRPAILATQSEPREIRHKRVKCFGVGESDLEAMLPDLIRRGREPSVGITVHRATITLRISALSRSQAESDAMMQPTLDTIHSCLGDLVYGYEDDELQHAVAKKLVSQGLSLATLECGTGGLIAHWLSELPNANAFYRGGEVLRPQPHASAPLGTTLLTQLAQQVRDKFAVDYVLTIGPFPTEPNAEEVTMLVTTATDTTAATIPYTGHPDILKDRIAKSGLNLLRKTLQ